MRIRRLFRFTSRTDDEIRRDVDDELAFHISMRTDALRQTGLSDADALAQARQEFGRRSAAEPSIVSSGRIVERRRRVSRLAAELKQDAVYGARLLARSPGFAVACIVTLAIGIGGNAAVFSVINTAFLAPPPIAAPEEVVRIQLGESQMSLPLFEELRKRSSVFATTSAIGPAMLALGVPPNSARLAGERVTTTYFEMLGVNAAFGRTFVADDTREDVVVISDRAWRVHFGGDLGAIGRRIQLDRGLYEVIGVMPPGFRGLVAPGWVRDCWIPVRLGARQPGVAATFQVAGRLRPGISRGQATAALRVTAQQLRVDRPELPESITAVELVPVDGINAFRGMGAMVPVFMFIALLTVLAGLVLLIGCANIAGLLLGRALARRHELVLRAALGAGRGRLMRQLLTESVLLAGLGGAAGVVLAVWLTSLVPLGLSQLPFPLELDAAIDWRVLAYTGGVSLVTAILFGLAPARHAAAFDLAATLRDTSPSGGRQRLRQALVIGQVAVCAMLLLWGLMFVRSLGNATSVDPGFAADGVMLADVRLREGAGSAPERRESQIIQLHERARELPFVESAGGAWSVPLALSSQESFPVFLADDPPGSRGRPVYANRLTPGWFATVRIPLLAGRDFTWNDRAGSPEVAIVNRTLEERFWNGGAIGRRLRFTGVRNIPHDVEIVGVVGDSKYWTLGEAIEPTVYLAARQGTMEDGVTLHVRTSNPADTSRRLSQELHRIAPDGDIELRPMSEAIAVAMMPARVGAVVTGACACVAVLLATMGVYALIAYNVAQRSREIGVRKALGATTSGIFRLIVGRSATLVSIGLVAGVSMGVAGAYGLRSLMVGIAPNDLLTIGLASTLVLLAGVLASGMPAIRASRTDPLQALRRE
jgi:predicted permease